MLPNYNHAQHLDRAITEIVEQTRRPDELLILDDASTDKSREIIADYAARHDFVRAFYNETNRGVVAGHERLLSESTGDYIYCAAADDRRFPRFFEVAMGMADEHPGAGILCGKLDIVDESQNLLGVVEVPLWREPTFADGTKALREYFDVVEASHSLSASTIYRRTSLEEIGGLPRQLGFWADTFAIRAISLVDGMCYAPEVFTAWTNDSRSFSGQARSTPVHILDVVETAAAMMRSEAFRDRFPHAHVNRWRKKYRWQTLRDFWWGLSTGDLPAGASRWHRYRVQLPRTWKALRLSLYRPKLIPPP